MRVPCISILVSILSALSLNSLSLAKPLSPRWDDMLTMHSWKATPDNWESQGRPPSGTTINLYIALKPRRENALIDALYEVSSPEHPKYGAHLSKEQVAELVAPHPNTLKLVNSWLEHHGVPSSSVSMTHGGNTLMLKGVPVNQANALLGASYQLYRNIERGKTIVRTVGYALPVVLHGHVLTVVPTTTFVSPSSQWQIPRNGSGGTGAGLVKSASGGPGTMLSSRIDSTKSVTPTFLRWLYYTSTYTPAATDRNVLGVAGYNGDYPSPVDLATFMRKFRPEAVDATFTVVEINDGGYDPNHPNNEANLDIQYAEAMAYPIPHIFYSTGAGPLGEDDWLITWLAHILEQQSIPQTISTSYDVPENLYSKEYAVVVCYLFAQLGLRGVSVLFSPGNEGVGKGNCVTKDGSVRFSPHFPATCPWVTAVGGTTGYLPEAGAKFSGGGFSDYFERPPYQERAVSPFLQVLGNRYRGLYNNTGRGIPDIAAQAIGFPIYLNKKKKLVKGTSASTPVVAGIISLVNDYLISKGRRPLGYLNPWLYGVGFQALLDVKSGSNPGCGKEGFSAIEGWDPVTGLGTPNFNRMLKLLGEREVQ